MDFNLFGALGRNRHLGWPLAVLAASLATALACTTFTSSAPESITADGGLSDSASPDGSSTDSASDASERFCASYPDAALCADFDDGELVVPPFSEVANAVVDTTTFASAPGSLRTVTMGVDKSFVRKTDFDDGAFQLVQRLSFDTHQGLPDGGDVTINAKLFRLDQDVTGCKIEFETLGGKVKLNVSDSGDGGTYEVWPVTDSLSGGKWHHVELLLALDGARVVATLKIDGKPSLNSTGVACAKLAAKPDLLMGLFGATDMNQALTGTAYFDNVLFESR